MSNGTCGKNLTWTLDDEGTLTISGTGDMDNYSWQKETPWQVRRDSIQEIIIEAGVTSIGREAFSNCKNLSAVKIPDGIISVGELAFNGCDSLTEIKIPDSVTHIGEGTFSNCRSLTEIKIPIGVTAIEGYFYELHEFAPNKNPRQCHLHWRECF